MAIRVLQFKSVKSIQLESKHGKSTSSKKTFRIKEIYGFFVLIFLVKNVQKQNHGYVSDNKGAPVGFEIHFILHNKS